MLLTRPFPDQLETLQSYVIRLARANHYNFEHWSQYLAQNSVPLRSKDSASRKLLVNVLIQVTGMTAVDNLFDQWQFFNTSKRYFDYKAIKICPECYSGNGGKLMAQWTLRNNLCCSKHRCLLVDACSDCGSLLSERTMHNSRCEHCQLLLSNLEITCVTSDFFSARVSQKVATGILAKHEVLLDELSWQSSHIEAFSLLIYEDNQALWRSKRSYTIRSKYHHQMAIGSLLNSDKLLFDAVKNYTKLQFEEGVTDLGKTLIRFNKYLTSEINPAILATVKTLISEGDFDDTTTVGYVWLSYVYDLERERFKQYLLVNFSTDLFKNRAIPASMAAKVVANYLGAK